MMMGVFAAGAGWIHDGGSMGQWVGQVGKTVLILVPAALAEELMFRGLPLVVAARAIGRGRAIVLLSVLFALAHLSNPEVTAAGIGNIALAGIFLSLAFYSPGGMWTAFGAHLGWNATLAALAAPVSGLPFDIPLHRLSHGQSGVAHRRRVRPRGRAARDRDAGRHGGTGRPVDSKGTDMSRAAVIGAGTMGNGIAHVFAQHGWSVALIDTVPARARARRPRPSRATSTGR